MTSARLGAPIRPHPPSRAGSSAAPTPSPPAPSSTAAPWSGLIPLPLAPGRLLPHRRRHVLPFVPHLFLVPSAGERRGPVPLAVRSPTSGAAPRPTSWDDVGAPPCSVSRGAAEVARSVSRRLERAARPAPLRCPSRCTAPSLGFTMIAAIRRSCDVTSEIIRDRVPPTLSSPSHRSPATPPPSMRPRPRRRQRRSSRPRRRSSPRPSPPSSPPSRRALSRLRLSSCPPVGAESVPAPEPTALAESPDSCRSSVSGTRPPRPCLALVLPPCAGPSRPRRGSSGRTGALCHARTPGWTR